MHQYLMRLETTIVKSILCSMFADGGGDEVSKVDVVVVVFIPVASESVGAGAASVLRELLVLREERPGDQGEEPLQWSVCCWSPTWAYLDTERWVDISTMIYNSVISSLVMLYNVVSLSLADHYKQYRWDKVMDGRNRIILLRRAKLPFCSSQWDR